MIDLFKYCLFIIATLAVVVSCSHQEAHDRKVASSNCWDSVKGEYHSYFDSVEKCIEKEADK